MTSSLSCINQNAAGIDIGSRSHYVAVPTDRDTNPVREFKFFTADLHKLADWLKECKIDTVAMEATGVFWIPAYDVLSSRGFDVYLVNARHIKNVSGRKSDVEDCQWIQQLHSFGLLRKSVIPDGLTLELRHYMRHRDNLIRQAARQLQLIEKGLSQMNLQLQNVVSDIAGKTGMLIIRAICAGERDAKKLAAHRDIRCKNSEEIIQNSLEGHYKKEVLFSIKQALATYDHYSAQIEECDKEIENKTKEFKDKAGDKEPPQSKKRDSKNGITFDVQTTAWHMLGVNLTDIPGINSKTALSIVSEIGTSVDFWNSGKQFASWLGLCPNNRISGGKRLSSKSRSGANKLKGVLRIAALAAGKTSTSIGAFFRRLRARLGTPKAITATAHKLAVLVYTAIKTKLPYIEKGMLYFEEQHKKKAENKLRLLAKQLGYDLLVKAEKLVPDLQILNQKDIPMNPVSS